MAKKTSSMLGLGCRWISDVFSENNAEFEPQLYNHNEMPVTTNRIRVPHGRCLKNPSSETTSDISRPHQTRRCAVNINGVDGGRHVEFQTVEVQYTCYMMLAGSGVVEFFFPSDSRTHG